MKDGGMSIFLPREDSRHTYAAKFLFHSLELGCYPSLLTLNT